MPTIDLIPNLPDGIEFISLPIPTATGVVILFRVITTDGFAIEGSLDGVVYTPVQPSPPNATGLYTVNSPTALAPTALIRVRATVSGVGPYAFFLYPEPPNTFGVVTTDYTIGLADNVVALDSTGGGFQVTLPPASAVPPGFRVLIADQSGACLLNNVKVNAGAGGDTILGLSTVVIAVSYGSMSLVSDGVSQWFGPVHLL